MVLPPDPLPDTGKGMEGFNKAISMDRQESRVAALMVSVAKGRRHGIGGRGAISYSKIDKWPRNRRVAKLL